MKHENSIAVLNLNQTGKPTDQNTDQMFRTFINNQKITAEYWSQGLHHMQSVSTIAAICGKGNIKLSRDKQNDAVDLP